MSVAICGFTGATSASNYDFVPEGVAKELGYASWDSGGGPIGVESLCDGTSDDDQMHGEYILMLFDQATNVYSMTFTGDHAIPNSATVLNY